jgi:predicted NBD/HSP70 family sugar kinase
VAKGVTGDQTGPGAVLALFRAGVVHTRADVARATGLARPTVSQRLDTLVDAGLLTSRGEAASTGGRPPARFAFDGEGGLFLVADVRAAETRLVATDLLGGTLTERTDAIDVGDGPRPVLDLVMAGHVALLERIGRPWADVRGIGVALPGPVEFATGRVISPPIMPGWDRFDVQGYLGRSSACPVLVDKDVNAMAFGEQRVCWPGHADMLMIEAGTGIGCGLIVHGELYRGALGAAGDLGHIPYAPVEGLEGEPVCRCGNVACVEAYAGGWALARDLRALGREAAQTRDVVNLILARDPAVMPLVRRAARVLGFAISDAVSLLNPSLVVVGGLLALADEPLLAGIREVVYRRSLPLATRNLQITVGRLGERAAVTGLTLMLGDRVFAPDAVDRLLGFRESDADGKVDRDNGP